MNFLFMNVDLFICLIPQIYLMNRALAFLMIDWYQVILASLVQP